MLRALNSLHLKVLMFSGQRDGTKTGGVLKWRVGSEMELYEGAGRKTLEVGFNVCDVAVYCC